MSLVKPRTMAGTMELLPLEQIAFQGMLDLIRRSYERFGFLPIETPVMELSEVLLTKSGGETERQVYLVQSTGAQRQGDLADLALRFDLTVPLARYVAQHERSLNFPFRRYQIQRVYRGESAQRGRFREFYQADVDVIGRDHLSIRYDAELPAVIDSLFRELKIGPFTIHLNNRKLMRGFFESVGIVGAEQQTLVLREVDKLDKRGAEQVRHTLSNAPFELPSAVVQQILDFVQQRSTGYQDACDRLAALPAGSELFELGRSELREVLDLVRAQGVPESNFAINLSIARGLDYYTGTVYETTLDEHPQIGSICSGGRYDDLASHYTRARLPGVGLSIGATRLFYQLREAGLIALGESSVDVLVTQLDDDRLPDYLALATSLRRAGIATEVALDGGKLARQLKHADKSGIRFALIQGADERARDVVQVRDLRRGDQFEVPRADLARSLRVELERARALP